uniref:Uncharacterized protein n=1 Tax=Aplanochytrium stocchinoi TaxID=215587 RepID=A0A6S8AQY9_9STRA
MYASREQHAHEAGEPANKKRRTTAFTGMQTKELPKFQFVASEDVVKLEECVKVADVICTATGSPTPLFVGKWLKANAHINAVGSYQANTTELDVETVMRSKIMVDTMAAFEAGDLKIPFQNCSEELKKKHLLGSLGKILNTNDVNTSNGTLSAARYRESDPKISVTLFKSVGCSVQDAATARVALKCCTEANIGGTFEI